MAKAKTQDQLLKGLTGDPLSQMFAIQAINEYSKQVIAGKAELMREQKAHEKTCKENGKVSLMNNKGWIQQAETTHEAIEEFYKQQ